MRQNKGFAAIWAILVFCLLFVAEIVNAGEVKFVHLTDIHLTHKKKNASGRMLGDSNSLFGAAISQINDMENIDFVIFTGDILNDPDKELFPVFKDTVKNLKPIWHWAIGNHDVGRSFNKNDYTIFMNEINHIKREKPYTSYVINDFLFICMDGAIQEEPTPLAKFSSEELAWLDLQLEKNKDKYAVIFQHFPVVEPFKSNDHYIINAKEYLEVLDRHENVTAVITGHYHAARINQRNNVLHISSPALVQYPNAFRVIKMSTVEDGVKFDFEYFPTKLEDVRKTSYTATRSSKFNEGNEKDRNTTIILTKKLD